MLSDGGHRLAISPQCGFAAVFEGNPITEEVGLLVWIGRRGTDEAGHRRNGRSWRWSSGLHGRFGADSNRAEGWVSDGDGDIIVCLRVSHRPRCWSLPSRSAGGGGGGLLGLCAVGDAGRAGEAGAAFEGGAAHGRLRGGAGSHGPRRGRGHDARGDWRNRRYRLGQAVACCPLPSARSYSWAPSFSPSPFPFPAPSPVPH